MKIPLSWLKEFIHLSFSPSHIAKLLTSIGLEVDAIQTLTLGCERVVVAQVIDAIKHPNSDRLTIATVTDGTQQYQIVCGAPNCRTGIKTALALVGAVLKDREGKETKIKETTVRGVESFGMLCSEYELNLSDQHEAIVEFATDLKVGADVAEIYADTVFEIALTPNLGHCASVLGIARELSAVTSEPIHYPKISFHEDPACSITELLKVSVLESTQCPRYTCRLIRDVSVAPSPEWLQRRLLACGIRPVNNLVDITNYVMMEMGQPIHAFDLDCIAGKEIIVRNAEQQETLMTLDHQQRYLSSDDLLICDQSQPLALAGILGGVNSEVSEKTKHVLLESAYFRPQTIRRTSKHLGIQTEASKRFERSVDPNQVIVALDRAVTLIQEIAGGQIATGVIDRKEKEFEKKVILCRLNYINRILGTHLSVNEIEVIFQHLGMQHSWDGKNVFHVTIPTYRADIAGEIDLVEEVARIYGFDNIGKSVPHYHASSLPDAPIFSFEREIRSKLIAEALQEFITCDLIGPSSLEVVRDTSMSKESLITVLNPTSLEQSVLRTSLLPGLLHLVKYNIDHQNHNVYGFEIGRIHFKQGDQYKEQSVVGIILTGKSRPHDWELKPHDLDFYDLKGMIENVLKELGVEDLSFTANDLNTLHTGRQAAIYVGSLKIGSLGEVHPSVIRRLDVSQKIFFAEINLHDLIQVRQPLKTLKEIPIYPASERDWTLTVPEDLLIENILSAIKSIPSRFLEAVTLIDIYRSEKIGNGLKNVTLHLVYRDQQKTISQNDVDAEHARLMNESLKIILNHTQTR